MTALVLVVGCGDPCLDDGLGKGECNNPPVASGSETQATDSNEAGTADATDSNEAGTADAGDGDGDSGDGDGDPGDGDGDGDTGGDGDPCMNGMQDPGETDVDCGGDCVEMLSEDDIEGQCGDGQGCLSIEDCVAGECDQDDVCNVCPDDPPEFDPIDLGYNSCQACLLSNCCMDIMLCMADIPKCVCWFNCVSSTADTQLCMDTCGNGNIGSVNSCMNSMCKADLNSMNCEAPP